MRVASSALLVCAVVSSAHAQTSEALAIEAFDEGRALLKEGRYPEACEAFERSQKLDPANGTLYNLAGCYVKVGKLATAWGAYRTLSETDTNPQRRQDSAAQASALAPRLPKLVVSLAGPPPNGLAVKLDELDYTSLLSTDNPIDLGPHTLTASAPGYAPWSKTFEITVEGKTETLEIQLVTAAPPPADPPPPGPPGTPEPPATEGRRGAPFSPTVGLVVGGIGVAGIATGIVFGLVARGRYDDAQFLCGEDDQLCPPSDVDTANDFVRSARSAATLSTIGVIGGAALVGAGLGMYLYARRAESSVQVTPGASGTPLGVTLGGAF